MRAPIVTVIGSLLIFAGCLSAALTMDKAENNYLRQLFSCLSTWWPFLITISLSGSAIVAIGCSNKGRLIAAFLCLTLPFAAMTYTVWRLPSHSALDLANYAGKGNCELTGTVETVRSKRSYVLRPIRMLWPKQEELAGLTLLTIYGGNPPVFKRGQSLKIIGKARETGSESYPSWLRPKQAGLMKLGVSSALRADVKTVQPIDAIVMAKPDEPMSWMKFWQDGRSDIIETHRKNLGGDKGDLLSSMVLGDRVVHLSASLKALFRAVGLSHLLAASGFNLSIVVASSYAMGRLVLSPSYASMAALLSTSAFVFLAGPSPSVVRAAVLCVMLLAAKLSARKLHVIAALSLTLVLALLADPLSASDVGLQLSYAATAGIICGMKVLQQPVQDQRQPLYKRLRKWFLDTISVICLAQLAVLPLQLCYFRTLGLLFLPANLLVDPVVAPVTVLGFLSSLIAFLCGKFPGGITVGALLTSPIDGLCSFLLDYMIYCATALSSMDGTTIKFSPLSPYSLIFYYACFCFFLYCLRVKPMRLLGTIVLTSGIACLISRPPLDYDLLYLSSKSLAYIQGGKAGVLNGKPADYPCRALLAYTGAKLGASSAKYINCSPQEALPPLATPRSRKGALRLAVFALEPFSILARDDGSGLSSPLPWSEARRMLQLLDEEGNRRGESIDMLKREGKPVIIWVSGRRSQLNQYRAGSGIYIATVRASFPVLLTLKREVSPGGQFLERLIGSKYRNLEFYPFHYLRQTGSLVVLQ